MELTQEQVLALMVSILGESVDEADGWRSTGSSSRRNVLLTEERIVTRVLNDFDQRILTALTSANGFSDRFDNVIGENYTIDKDTFDEIGSNLIVAIRDLQKQVVDLREQPGYVPTDEEKMVLESGITKEILDDILETLLNSFYPSTEQLAAMDSGITLEGLVNIKNDIINLQYDKMENDAFIPMTEEDLQEIVNEVFSSN